MPRLTRLEDVLFQVEEHPVFASVNTGSREQRLPVPGKKAIVNCDSGRVLSIMSRSYRLVSNREALEWAVQCCRTVFPETKPGEWEAKATDAPATAGHCFIDLVHNSTTLDFAFVPAKDRPDAFGPFIRVTNSYNGLRALGFEIGFYRKVCKNGLILPDVIIRFKFTHLRRDIGQTIKFEIDHSKLTTLKAAFGEYLGALQGCEVSRAEFEPLVCAVLLIQKPKSAKPHTRDLEEWNSLQGHLKQICDRYVQELGENAYAAFNAITEFASHPPHNRCIYRERHSFQRRAGAWLTDFGRLCREPEFEFGAYMEKMVKSNGNVSNAKSPDRGLRGVDNSPQQQTAAATAGDHG